MMRVWVLRVGLFVADVLVLEAVFFATYWWRFQTGLFANPVSFTAPELLFPSVFVTLYWTLLFAWFGLYRFDPLLSRAHIVMHSFKATALGVLVLFIVTFDPGQPLPASRIILACYSIAIYLTVAGNRVGLLTVLRELRLRGVGRLNSLLVGGGTRAAEVLRYLSLHPELGMKVTGVLANNSVSTVASGSLPVIGRISDLRKCLRSRRYDAVFFAPENREERFLGRMMRILRSVQVRSFIQADQYQVLVGAVKPTHISGHPLIEVRPELLSPIERAMKRQTDIVLSVLILAITSPIWLALAFAIPMDSRGPLFYRQRRVGLNGEEFTLIKFRSMVHDAEAATGAIMASKDDPRITRVGRLIRAVHLDELPQLLNVLFGHMSLVGPRPERIEFVEEFVKKVPLYERRLNVKPGLTGWSQVHLKYDSNADSVSLKLKYDFFYIENMTLPLDMKILLMTLFVALRGEGR
jgi:exopolysaccharide biosynthesis polyprenyl glycosylphosphotransferase